jgi:hypothetical protein
MKNQEISRRNFLLKMTAVTGATMGMAGILTGCGGGGESETEAPDTATPAPMATATCTDVSGITDAEAQMRNTLGYVDASVKDGQTCGNCALFVAPAQGASCGTCTLLKGPINTNGYCVSWAMATA